MALITCPECHKEVSDHAATCPSCGYPIHGVRATTAIVVPSKSRGVAVLLALLLGGFGIHKFYLNRPGQGFFYLIFCWTFIPAIIAFFEAIGYLLTTDAEFRGKYGA